MRRGKPAGAGFFVDGSYVKISPVMCVKKNRQLQA